VLAEQAASTSSEMSDHYHPWVEAQGHKAPFTWSLAACDRDADRANRARHRGSPARRCATHPGHHRPGRRRPWPSSPTGGSPSGRAPGERLNEHVTGEGFPARRVRHERFREALEIIRLLWQGGYRSYDGKYIKLEDARVFDLPEELPVIAVGRRAVPSRRKIAAELGDGLFAVEPDGELVSRLARDRRPMARPTAKCRWPGRRTSGARVRAVLEKNSFALQAGRSCPSCPTRVNFEAVTARRHAGPGQGGVRLRP